MSLVEFFSQPVWHRLGLTLVHFLWQGLAVAVIACVVVRFLGLKRGSPRYVAYLLAFSVMAACPAITFIALDRFTERPTVVAVPMQEIESPAPASYTPAPTLSPTPARRPGEPHEAVALTSDAPPGMRLQNALQASLPWVLMGWMGGVLILSVRLLLGFVGVRRWRRNLEPLTNGLDARVGLLSERLGMPGFSRVFVSRRALEVVALGYLRPMVLLPATLVTQMPPEMLEAVIAA